MNTFLFCMIFLQVCIFLIASSLAAYKYIFASVQVVRTQTAQAAVIPTPSRGMILTRTEIDYFRSSF